MSIRIRIIAVMEQMEPVRMTMLRTMEVIVMDTRTIKSKLPRNPTALKKTCSHEQGNRPQRSPDGNLKGDIHVGGYTTQHDNAAFRGEGLALPRGKTDPKLRKMTEEEW